MKTCRNCGETKSREEFPHRHTTCRKCRADQRRQQRETRKRGAEASLYVFPLELWNFIYGPHPGEMCVAIDCRSQAMLVEFQLDEIDGFWKRPVCKPASRRAA